MSEKNDVNLAKNQRAFLNIIKNTVSDDFLKNIDKVIYELLQSVSLSDVLDEKNTASEQSFCEILTSVKLILEVVEWNLKAKDVLNCNSGLDDVLQCVRDILDQKPSDNVITCALDLLQVASRLCSLQVDYKNILRLSKFYLYNLHLVQHNSSEDDLRLRLRALSVILVTLKSVSNKESVVIFREECQKLNDSLVESKLFSFLILKSHDNISAQVLVTILPHFVELFDDLASLQMVWNEGLEPSGDDHDLKQFGALCYLFDVFSSKKTAEGTEVFLKLLQDEKYWYKLQYGLTHVQSVSRRQSLYLMKRSVQELFDRNVTLSSHTLNEISGTSFVDQLDEGLIKISNGMKNFAICNSKMFLISSGNENVMWWHVTLKEELLNLFNDVFLVLETLEEKQAHIVKPVFQTMIRLIGPAVCPFRNGKRLHISWILVLFQKALQHDNAAVVRWGLINLMEVDITLYQTPDLLKKILHLLVKHLNNPSIFLNDMDVLRNNIKRYFSLASSALGYLTKLFFQTLLEEICLLTWSPEPLFLVLDALQDVKVMSWETKQLQIVKRFVTTSIATMYTFLRAAVQCHILQMVINFTDVAAVSLDEVSDLLSVFRGSECLQRGSTEWKCLATWMEYCFSKRNAEDFILANIVYNPENPVEVVRISRMICLLYDAHLFGIMKCCGEVPSCKVIVALMDLLRSFKDVNKRLYAAPAGLLHNICIVRGILRENLAGDKPETSRLVEIILPHFADILGFVVSRSDGLSNIADYDTACTFIEIVELILKAQRMFRVNSELYTNDLFTYSLKSLGVTESATPSPLVAYLCMHYLKLIIEYVYHDSVIPRLKLLHVFFKRTINVPLPKCEDEILKAPNSLWGRMNSEYLEAQWRVIGRLKSENLLTVGQKVRVEEFLSAAELCDESLSALDLGNGPLLLAVLSAVEDLLPELPDEMIDRLMQVCWSNVWERRRCEAFVSTSRRFIAVFFQSNLIQRPGSRRLLLVYSSLLLSESVHGLANAFMAHVQTLGIKYAPNPLWEEVLASAVLFGTSRREDRLTQEVCTVIASLQCSANELVPNEWNSNNDVRARALQIILTLSPGKHTNFADAITEALLNKELQLVGNKSRSFEGSPVHLIRTRVLQALLLLEPLLSKERSIQIYHWLCGLLLRECHQPSVRVMAEWLIVRILGRNEELQSAVWLNLTQSLEQRVGSMCSFISVVYHILQILPDTMLETWLDQAVYQFLPYCLAQHFSLRLYAQVAIEKIWQLAIEKGYQTFLEKYRIIWDCQLRVIGNGNAQRSAEKLRKDFYWTMFHPLRHYSLLAIFRDLPRLLQVRHDEWITSDNFIKVGVPSNLTTIPWSSGDELWQLPISSFVERNEESMMAVSGDNVQKKMIPIKSLLPDYEGMLIDSCSAFSRKKHFDTGGLVVVASLVDRPANLGGLSRTCEAFGVSELVIDSLQMLEDKQFQSLSVTSEKWVPITEVKAHYLSDYLVQKKGEGYTVIGAEQTSRSQSLHGVQFPRKSVLLLGSEKEGIPPQLLPFLDICVEVPQLGVVRSLNVHVTGALFIWQYVKQHTSSLT